jgi:hypothetical protein
MMSKHALKHASGGVPRDGAGPHRGLAGIPAAFGVEPLGPGAPSALAIRHSPKKFYHPPQKTCPMDKTGMSSGLHSYPFSFLEAAP